MIDFDIAIVGGGMVGLSFAHAITNSGFSCILIDKQGEESLYSPALDNRGVALSSASIQILKDLSLWEHLLHKSYGIKSVHVTEKGRFGFATIEAENYGIDNLGYVVSAYDMGYVLTKQLKTRDALEVLRPINIKSLFLDPSSNHWHIVLDNKSVKARLLIAADGTNSYIRQSQNIGVKKFKYRQNAVIANVSLIQPHLGVAYQRFINSGSLAMLPFGDKRLKCILAIHEDFSKHLLDMPSKEFLEYIQQQFGFRLGKFFSVGDRISFPLEQVRANSITKLRLVLLGNAANTIHPVAAQGFNLGLRDASVLAKILRIAKAKGQDIGARHVLEKYAKGRKPDHDATTTFAHYLSQIFKNSRPGVRFSRQSFLIAVHLMRPLNKILAWQGMGYKGQL